MSEPRYVLNVNPGEQDVLHRDPTEVCNTDDAAQRLNVDIDTADALLAMDEARACQHCMKENPS